MNPKLKLLITILVILGLLALFFWATGSISRLTGHSITGTSIGNPVGIGGIEKDTSEDVSVDEMGEDSNGQGNG